MMRGGGRQSTVCWPVKARPISWLHAAVLAPGFGTRLPSIARKLSASALWLFLQYFGCLRSHSGCTQYTVSTFIECISVSHSSVASSKRPSSSLSGSGQVSEASDGPGAGCTLPTSVRWCICVDTWIDVAAGRGSGCPRVPCVRACVQEYECASVPLCASTARTRVAFY